MGAFGPMCVIWRNKVLQAFEVPSGKVNPEGGFAWLRLEAS